MDINQRILYNRRVSQFYHNLGFVLGCYQCELWDYPEDTEYMTREDWIVYVKSRIFDIKVNEFGRVTFKVDICKDLNFLGNDFIEKAIISNVEKEGWVL